MRRGLAFSLTAIVAAGGAAAGACGAFGSDDAKVGVGTDAGDAAPPDVSSESSPGGATDGATGGDLRATCPPSRAPGCATAASCTIKVLRAPKSGLFPFGFTSDETHVYWAEQEQVDGGGDAYNGHASARIVRAAKVDGSVVTLADGEPQATVIALDGDFVYWGTSDPTILRRVRRKCSPPCPPPESVPIGPGAGTRVVAIQRPTDGRLAALRDNGQFVVLNTSTSPPAYQPISSGARGFVTMVVTNDVVHVAGNATSQVHSIALADLTTYTTSIPPGDAGQPVGFSPMTTDCAVLWAMRDRSLYEVVPQAEVSLFTATPVRAFALRADARNVYVAAPDAGGVFAVDKATREVFQIYPGNVFDLAVDDDGVYWGDHDRQAGGGVMMWQK